MATVVTVFVGEYDLVHQASLRAEFKVLQFEAQNLILDMSAVTYVDSTFIKELIRLHNVRTARGNGRLTIVRGAVAVKRVFAMFYVGTFCRIVDTLDEALPQDSTPVVIRSACRGAEAAWSPWQPSETAAHATTAAWISNVLVAAGYP